MKKGITAIAVAAACYGLAAMPVMAAPIELPDGSVFDPEFYAEANPDVVANFSADPVDLYIHYALFGEDEGRLPWADLGDFDAAYYAENNADVVKVVGNSPAALFQHYVMVGEKEGRKAKGNGTTIATVTEFEVVEDSDVDVFLSNVYTLMAAEEYDEVALNYDGTEIAQAIAEVLPEDDCILFTADGIVADDYTGVAAGVYKISGGGYYFFYGNLVNGIRTGEGASCWSTTAGYETFTGTFANDDPNGEGQDIIFYDDGEIVITTGTYKDGLENGDMNKNLIADGVFYPETEYAQFTAYTAVMGDAPALDLGVYAGSVWEDAALNAIQAAQENNLRIYWFSYSDTANYAHWFWYDPTTTYLAALGYAIR